MAFCHVLSSGETKPQVSIESCPPVPVCLVALVLVGEVVVLRPARLGLAARAEAATADVHQGRRRRNLEVKLVVSLDKTCSFLWRQ